MKLKHDSSICLTPPPPAFNLFSYFYLQQPFPFSQKLRNKKLFFHTSIVISYGMYQVADGLSLFGMLTVVCVCIISIFKQPWFNFSELLCLIKKLFLCNLKIDILLWEYKVRNWLPANDFFPCQVRLKSRNFIEGKKLIFTHIIISLRGEKD